MKTLITMAFLMIVFSVNAQSNKIYNYSNIKPAEWVIPVSDTVSYSFGEYQGQKALLMKRKYGNYKTGTAIYPKDLKFTDGIIEFDAAWGGKQGGYLGFAFRIKDQHHYETVYFRPESSGTINAVQYMPEKQAEFNWWNYEANKYQAKATLPLHNWFHIKAIVKDNAVSIFVDNQPKPVMVYKPLDSSLKTGSVGFWFGNSSDCAYKNLVVTKMSEL